MTTKGILKIFSYLWTHAVEMMSLKCRRVEICQEFKLNNDVLSCKAQIDKTLTWEKILTVKSKIQLFQNFGWRNLGAFCS